MVLLWFCASPSPPKLCCEPEPGKPSRVFPVPRCIQNSDQEAVKSRTKRKRAPSPERTTEKSEKGRIKVLECVFKQIIYIICFINRSLRGIGPKGPTGGGIWD